MNYRQLKQFYNGFECRVKSQLFSHIFGTKPRRRTINPVTCRISRVFKLCVACAVTVFILFNIIRSDSSYDDYDSSWGIESHKDNMGKKKSVPFMTPYKIGNFEPIEEPVGDGPGEGGKPYVLPSARQNEMQKSFGEYGMNMAASNDISLTRTIPDTRMPECKHWQYPEHMGLTASVVLVFHNEGFSTLMRNVHTIIKRTPPEMLEEIVLVDDFSDKDDLKGKLDTYVEQFHGKVRVIRNSQREGLIRTRTIGAESSKGDVVVFLDAHCEVNRNWLPPLLAPIYRDRTTMTVPFIDGVDYNSFEYRPVYAAGTLFRGIWEWGMYYKETELPPEMDAARKLKSEPYKSPSHAGGLFAIDRKYFLELGAYDEGLLVWGGENFELSFKIWQCGGSIEWVPCSRVGHVYRGFMPYSFGKLAEKHKGSLVTINYKRVIEVWWEDKYKEFFYTRDPLARYLDHGDISKQLALKRKLNCNSFRWFMDNVAPDLLLKYPELPPNLHWGELKNQGSQTCLESQGMTAPTKMVVGACNNYYKVVRLNTEGQIGIGERCVDADKNVVRLIYCPMGTAAGPWLYDEETKLLKHKHQGRCLVVHPSSKQLMLRECDVGNTYHEWTWQKIKSRY